ncbi:MAG: hypothetical protein MZV70_35000 [Desulfobacterales bacterium]|nr:hypothetical protein [Desulfobacterales bacterium]
MMELFGIIGGGGVEVSVDSGQTWDLRLSGITAYSTDIVANSNGNAAVTILYKDGNSRMYKSMQHWTNLGRMPVGWSQKLEIRHNGPQWKYYTCS